MPDAPYIRPGTNIRPGQELAVVVGAGGMGSAVARRLGQTCRVLLADRDGVRLEKQVAALRDEGLDAVGEVCDVTQAQDVTALAARATNEGPVRALAHVVGLSPSMGDWKLLMTVNLIGAALVERAFRPVIARGGAAVFVSSVAGHIAPPPDGVVAILDDPLAPGFGAAIDEAVEAEKTSSLAYQYSKFALMRMCQRRARAWGDLGLRILSISPGLIATPMGALEFERQPFKYGMLERTPLRREGTMIEVADAIEFLLSNHASFISGVDLLVDGGLHAANRHANE